MLLKHCAFFKKYIVYDLNCTNFRTDASGPKGKGFKIIITAYNDGKYSLFLFGVSFTTFLHEGYSENYKNYEQLTWENMSMHKLSTQSIRSRNFLTLSLSGHSVFVIVDLSFFNTTNEKGFLLCTKHCTRKSSPSIFSIEIGVLVFFLRKENYKVYTNSQESFPKLTIPCFRYIV